MYGKTSGKKHARTQRDNTCAYYSFLTNFPCSYLKIQKRLDQTLDITLDKSVAMGGLIGWILLCGLHLTLAKSDHEGFPTWLSNNLE